MVEDWNLSEMTQTAQPQQPFTVLGLLGPAGSGKDLVADWFAQKGFVKIAFADPMKRFAQAAFGISTEQLWGPTSERNREFDVDESWWFEAIGHFGEASKEIIHKVLETGDRTTGYMKLHDWLTKLRKDYREKISTRVILQTLGTEWGREIDDTMWVRYAYQSIEQIKRGVGYSQTGGLVDTEAFVRSIGAIIPDHRFVNEVESSQKIFHAYVMRVRRLALEKTEEQVGLAGHKSEAEQKTIPDSAFDHVFNFEEGVDKVYQTLEGAYEHQLWINTRSRS